MDKKQGSRERDLEHIAGLIREGYTSGFEPVWYIDITGPFNDFRYLDNELKDIIEENIAYVVKGGYESYVGVKICIGVDEFSEEVVKSLGFDDDDIKDARESDYPELSFYVDYDLNYEVPYDEYDEEKGGSGVDCEEKVADEESEKAAKLLSDYEGEHIGGSTGYDIDFAMDDWLETPVAILDFKVDVPTDKDREIFDRVMLELENVMLKRNIQDFQVDGFITKSISEVDEAFEFGMVSIFIALRFSDDVNLDEAGEKLVVEFMNDIEQEAHKVWYGFEEMDSFGDLRLP